MGDARWRLLPAMVLAVVVAGCAGGQAATPSPTVPATPYPSPLVAPRPTPEGQGVARMLSRAVEATLAEGTATFAMDITFEGNGTVLDGAGIRATGALGFGGRRQASMRMDLTSLGSGVLSVILDDPVMYLRFDGDLGVRIPAGTWLRIDDSSTGEIATTFRNVLSGPNDSTLPLYYLLGATGEGRVLGKKELGGVTTTWVRTELDLALALDRVPVTVHDALVVNMAKLRSQGLAMRLGVEVWVGEDGLVHQERVTYRLPASMGGGRMVNLTTFSDHGEPLHLGVPADEEVIPADDAEITGSQPSVSP